MNRLPGRSRGRLLPLAAVLLFALPAVVGWHWSRLGWRDHHENYPRVPSGYDEIVQVFGQPCNDNAGAIPFTVTYADTGEDHTFWFHRKLGGAPTEMISDKGGRSTMVDNDIFGHIHNQHLADHVKSGVGGYVCRAMRGSDSWSAHAWGIAIDLSWNYEHYPAHYHSHVNYHFAPIWLDHGWTWGKQWGDAMHFQYATDY